MKLLVNLAKANPIGTQGLFTLVGLALAAEVDKRGDRVRDGYSRLPIWMTME
jgi:hypothetical protein